MSNKDFKASTNRRGFLGSLAGSAAAMGLATLTPSLSLHAENTKTINDDDPDAWFDKIQGKHRMMYDVTKPSGILPFVWARGFLVTNVATGTAEKDSNVVVILRHDAIPFAFEDRIWTKYKFGELFKVTDDATQRPSERNAFWKPAKGTYVFPGLGEVAIGINELQDSGVMFCVCNVAMTVYSTIVSAQMKMKPEDVMNDWKTGLLPGVQIVPSGVWAVGRAQEHRCAYCFVG